MSDLGLADVVAWSCAWAAFGIASGWFAARLPTRRLANDGPLTRLRPWERGGRVYRRVGVHRWKDRLPEAGSWFADGMSKRGLPGRSPHALRRFAAETRRAELVHWWNAAFGATFLLWTPAAVGWLMVGFGLVAHLPFVVVQRYNRGRITSTLARADRRAPACT